MPASFVAITWPRIPSLASARAAHELGRWLWLLLLVAVSACTQVQLIGDYDAVIDQGVTSVQKKAETYFGHLDSAPETPFSQSFYDDLDVDLKTLTTRAQATPKYGIVEQQLVELRNSVGSLRELDRITPRPVTKDAERRSPFTAGLATLEQQVRQILKLQLALKRGENGATAAK